MQHPNLHLVINEGRIIGYVLTDQDSIKDYPRPERSDFGTDLEFVEAYNTWSRRLDEVRHRVSDASVQEALKRWRREWPKRAAAMSRLLAEGVVEDDPTPPTED